MGSYRSIRQTFDRVPDGIDDERFIAAWVQTALAVARHYGIWGVWVQRRDPEGIETETIARLVELDGRRVIDVGCGGGRLTTFAATRAAYVYAFDPDAGKVEKAAAALPADVGDRVRFAVHDADALDVERERFDLALCGWSL